MCGFWLCLSHVLFFYFFNACSTLLFFVFFVHSSSFFSLFPPIQAVQTWRARPFLFPSDLVSSFFSLEILFFTLSYTFPQSPIFTFSSMSLVYENINFISNIPFKETIGLKLPLFHWSLFFKVLSIFIIHVPSQTPGYSGFLPPFPNIPRRVGIKEKRKFEGGQGSSHCPNT